MAARPTVSFRRVSTVGHFIGPRLGNTGWGICLFHGGGKARESAFSRVNICVAEQRERENEGPSPTDEKYLTNKVTSSSGRNDFLGLLFF